MLPTDPREPARGYEEALSNVAWATGFVCFCRDALRVQGASVPSGGGGYGSLPYHWQSRDHKLLLSKYTDDESVKKQVTLPNMVEVTVDDKTLATHEFYTYYHPMNTNFAAVDSWVLTRPDPGKPPILLTFQMTLNMEKHDTKESGLERVNKLTAGIPHDAQRYLVILTPMNVKPRITVRKGYLTNKLLKGGNCNEVFPVFRYQISDDELFRPPTF